MVNEAVSNVRDYSMYVESSSDFAIDTSFGPEILISIGYFKFRVKTPISFTTVVKNLMS